MKNKFKLRPINENILVERIIEEKTKGGIIIPDNCKGSGDKSKKGIVLGVGNKVRSKELKIGVKVAYFKFAGFEFEEDGVKYSIIKEENILGVLDDK
jgi:chaperonin GroES